MFWRPGGIAALLAGTDVGGVNGLPAGGTASITGGTIGLGIPGLGLLGPGP